MADTPLSSVRNMKSEVLIADLSFESNLHMRRYVGGISRKVIKTPLGALSTFCPTIQPRLPESLELSLNISNLIYVNLGYL